jgi:hypothetical protein
VFIRTQTNGDRTYLLLVENERVNGRLAQRVLHRLGRLDEVRASGQLDAVLKSLGRFSDKLLVLDAHARGESLTTKTVGVGPALIVERVWRRLWHPRSGSLRRDGDHRRQEALCDPQRDQVKGTLGKVFQAAGVVIPPALRSA